MYLKKFHIRWSDLDPNRHLANSAYINFMSATRMAYLIEKGFGHREMAQSNIGPILFKEQIHYFKEVFQGKPLYVSLEIGGLSDDGAFYNFIHNFYNYKGENIARGEMMGAWLDLKTRKIIPLPKDFHGVIVDLEKTKDFKVLTKEDTRKDRKVPESITLPVTV